MTDDLVSPAARSQPVKASEVEAVIKIVAQHFTRLKKRVDELETVLRSLVETESKRHG